ncbi:MAG: TIGR03986 family CRISPR-associated RAMP protein [Anaerolineae bacterium]|nr:TIGR03986 family CRISPR-associated RAMP protein [Anaerolineae bacterium]
MKWPQHKNPTQENRTAHAPYNFVPLPEIVVTVEPPPDQDRYYTGAQETYRYTGYLDCTLTTLTPLYTRCMMTTDFYEKYGGVPFYDLKPEQQQERAKFFHIHDVETPVIPGSSLRGMTRALVEIVGYGKMSWVSKSKMFFRAVAGGDNPLATTYEDLLGEYGRFVKAGYVIKQNGKWCIQPALCPKNIDLKERGPYVKIKDQYLKEQGLDDFLDFNHPDYKPQYHQVSFTINNGRVAQIGTPAAKYPYMGVLVCAGNMLETNSDGVESPRKRHTLVLAKNQNVLPLPINEQALEDYLDSLTEFQKTAPFDERMGCLIEGNPIFYVEDDGQVFLFGHSPNFRVPMRLANEKRAATAFDLIPEALRDEKMVDLADAIFGYVKDKKVGKGKARACAGRVFFTDAHYQADSHGVWLTGRSARDEAGIITPKILSSPKPTSFQHYLVQENPDDPGQLNHYGSDQPGEKTILRGHKLYWHKKTSLADIRADPQAAQEFHKQHTRIQPVKEGVTFHFKVHFENLSEVELGALLWVLELPPGHYHKLGMGKPLGMGSVAIKPRLYLNKRLERYAELFAPEGNSWRTGFSGQANDDEEVKSSKKKFEGFIKEKLQKAGFFDGEEFQEQARIQALLCLLRGVPSPARPLADYLPKPEDFKERRVLPPPQAVWAEAQEGQQLETWIDQREVEAALLAGPPTFQYAIGDHVPHRFTEAASFGEGKVHFILANGERGFVKMTEAKFKQYRHRDVLLEVVEVTGSEYHFKLIR